MPKEMQNRVSDEELELEDLDEATAAETLKPGGGSGGGDTKAETLATFTALLAQLGKDDLTNLFDQVQAQYGPGKDLGVKDNSASNRDSVSAKPSSAIGKGAWKEDVDALFAGVNLTEDFQERAAVIFEAAVNTRVNVELARLEEEFDAAVLEITEEFDSRLEEETENVVAGIVEKLDQYLDYVADQWMEENRLAVETSLRTDITESFIQNLQKVFQEHYIEIPDERLDVVAEMNEELEYLRSKLDSILEEKAALESVVNEAMIEAAIDEVSEGLVATQAEKLRELAEGIEFVDADTYRKKLEIIKENYFTNRATSKSTGLIVESIDGIEGDTSESVVPAHMSKYMQAISKSVK